MIALLNKIKSTDLFNNGVRGESAECPRIRNMLNWKTHCEDYNFAFFLSFFVESQLSISLLMALDVMRLLYFTSAAAGKAGWIR